MTRRPWWNKPEWTRHVETTPAAEAARPREERCGMTAAEQANWLHITAHLGIDHAEATQRRRHSLDWLELVGRVALLAVIIAVLIGVTS